MSGLLDLSTSAAPDCFSNARRDMLLARLECALRPFVAQLSQGPLLAGAAPSFRTALAFGGPMPSAPVSR